MKWLLQDTHLKIHQMNKEYSALQSLNLDFIPFGLLEDGEITGLYETFDKCIVRSGIKVLRLATSKTIPGFSTELQEIIKNGYDYNYENFEQSFISKFNLPLLNTDGEFIDMNNPESLNISFGNEMFIKPSNDQKAFIATILPERQTIRSFLESIECPLSRLKDEKLLLSSVKSLKGEYRFICIEDSIAEVSKYMENGKLDVEGCIPQKVIDAAKEYAKLFQPANIYSMDLVETNKGIYIVEYNCWNVSGLYNIDRKSLFNKVNEYKLSISPKKKFGM